MLVCRRRCAPLRRHGRRKDNRRHKQDDAENTPPQSQNLRGNPVRKHAIDSLRNVAACDRDCEVHSRSGLHSFQEDLSVVDPGRSPHFPQCCIVARELGKFRKMLSQPPREWAEPEDTGMQRREPLHMAVAAAYMATFMSQHGSSARLAPAAVRRGQKDRRSEGGRTAEVRGDAHIRANDPFLAKSHRTAADEPDARKGDRFVPGGVPEDHVVITTAQIWTTDFHPVRPGALQVTLLPVRHLTAIDSVDATLRLELTAATSSFSRARWRCSFESHLQLVDHEAALPLLWDLREDARGSKRQSWLALYDPATGPIRALFDSPVRARSFARWLRDTRSLKAGTFQLGMLEQNDGDATHAGTQTDPQVTSSFRPATPDDLGALEVRRLGEN